MYAVVDDDELQKIIVSAKVTALSEFAGTI